MSLLFSNLLLADAEVAADGEGFLLDFGLEFAVELLFAFGLLLDLGLTRLLSYTLRTCVSACRGGTHCTICSRFSPCREDSRCTPHACFSACREGRGCTTHTSVSPCREDTSRSSGSRFSPCREGRGCTPCTCVSPCRGDKGYTPCTDISPYRESIALFPSRTISSLVTVRLARHEVRQRRKVEKS